MEFKKGMSASAAAKSDFLTQASLDQAWNRVAFHQTFLGSVKKLVPTRYI
jgi:hypothetical protein